MPRSLHLSRFYALRGSCHSCERVDVVGPRAFLPYTPTCIANPSLFLLYFAALCSRDDAE